MRLGWRLRTIWVTAQLRMRHAEREVMAEVAPAR